MVKVLSFRFQHFSARLPCDLSKGPLKRDFLDVYLTTLLGVRKSKNTCSMRVIFVLKCSTFNLNLKNTKKKKKKKKKYFENIFRFVDNCILKSCTKFPFLRREYLSSAVNG